MLSHIHCPQTHKYAPQHIAGGRFSSMHLFWGTRRMEKAE